jgi:hypothetical protein
VQRTAAGYFLTGNDHAYPTSGAKQPSAATLNRGFSDGNDAGTTARQIPAYRPLLAVEDNAVTARLRFILIILPAVQRTAAGYFPEMAMLEGEGDLSLEYWQQEHQRFFQREGYFHPETLLAVEDNAVTARLRFILIILPAVQRTAAGYFLTVPDVRRKTAVSGNPESRIF